MKKIVYYIGLDVHKETKASSEWGASWHCPCSAELHSAVSQIFNLQRADSPTLIEQIKALPNTIRRYSRLKICATMIRT